MPRMAQARDRALREGRGGLSLGYTQMTVDLRGFAEVSRAM